MRRATLVGVVSVAAILFVGNPSEVVFRAWLAAHYEARIDADSYSRIAALDSGVADAIKNDVEHPRITVERWNLLLGSVFTAHFGGARLHFVGVLGQFVSLDR